MLVRDAAGLRKVAAALAARILSPAAHNLSGAVVLICLQVVRCRDTAL
jgi:hypothetical protein